MTTKIHALVDALGNPCNLMLTPGQKHDLTCARPLLENVHPGALIGDKAYDADSLIDTLNQLRAMSKEPEILLDRRGTAGIVTLNRPDAAQCR